MLRLITTARLKRLEACEADLLYIYDLMYGVKDQMEKIAKEDPAFKIPDFLKRQAE